MQRLMPTSMPSAVFTVMVLLLSSVSATAEPAKIQHKQLLYPGWQGRKLLLPEPDASASRTSSQHAPSATKAAPTFAVACSSQTESKQSCMFSNVCLKVSGVQSWFKRQTLSAFLRSSTQPELAELLKKHLNNVFDGLYEVDSTAAKSLDSTAEDEVDTSTFQLENQTTLLWHLNGANQESFGHVLINEAFPMFLVLQNHLGPNIPTDVQLLAAGNWHYVLHHVVNGTVATNAQLFHDKIAALPSGSGLCFSQLIIGDGGYVAISRASLANSGQHHAQQYAEEPSVFSTSNWWSFSQHALQLNGVLTSNRVAPTSRPLIVLNDKRFGKPVHGDRRMINDIDTVAANISKLYPFAEVRAVRFRDMTWAEQLKLLSRAKVFITTQGSSAFRLVFLPKGAFCIMLGSPEVGGNAIWKPFHELDRWFPLTYAQFMRYEIAEKNTEEYAESQHETWVPDSREERRQWRLYNADIKINMDKLRHMLNRALEVPKTFK